MHFSYSRTKTADNSLNYKIVTIETSTTSAPTTFSKLILPFHFGGINGYEQDCEYRFSFL